MAHNLTTFSDLAVASVDAFRSRSKRLSVRSAGEAQLCGKAFSSDFSSSWSRHSTMMKNSGGEKKAGNQKEIKMSQMAHVRDCRRVYQLQDKVEALEAEIAQLRAGGDRVMEDVLGGNTEAGPALPADAVHGSNVASDRQVAKRQAAASLPAALHLGAAQQATADELLQAEFETKAARKAADAARHAQTALAEAQKQANIDRYRPLWLCKQELIMAMQSRTPGPPRLSGHLFCRWMKYLMLLFTGLLTLVAPLDFSFTSLADNPHNNRTKQNHDALLAGIASFVEAKDDSTAALFLVRQLRPELRKYFIRKMIEENAEIVRDVLQEADMADSSASTC
eukprot:jgi/Ulvmu1/5476/UM023_0012.1